MMCSTVCKILAYTGWPLHNMHTHPYLHIHVSLARGGSKTPPAPWLIGSTLGRMIKKLRPRRFGLALVALAIHCALPNHRPEYLSGGADVTTARYLREPVPLVWKAGDLPWIDDDKLPRCGEQKRQEPYLFPGRITDGWHHMGGGRNETVNIGPEQQPVRKRTLKRVLRLLALRGRVHYRGTEYTLRNVHTLINIDTCKSVVEELHERDSSITKQLLEDRGLWGLIRPVMATRWEPHNLRVRRDQYENFGYSIRNSTDPRDPREATWEVTLVRAGGPASVAGLTQSDRILSQWKEYHVSDSCSRHCMAEAG